LLSNLISNSVKHNKRNGKIDIVLTEKNLVITNTGNAAAIDASHLFTRFYNPTKAEGSTGLGLSIVKQICEVSGFEITYQHTNSMHNFSVMF
ncbi:MAG: sensor histidine kinase, partial [Sphingobacteriaceae bacterium]